MGRLTPGQKLLNGAIEIVERIGERDVGEVYRVTVHRQGRRDTMALRCFDPKVLESYGIEAAELIHREGAALSRIAHPGVIAVNRLELEGSVPFILEEYLAGGDLGRLLEQRRLETPAGRPLLSPAEIAHLGLQISSALVALHQQGLFHSDLKPRKLGLRHKDSLEVVITDFDRAAFLEGALVDRPERLASLAYLPPERTGFVASPASSSSDIYALGVTLYECAVGTPPFSGQDDGDLINRLLYEVPRPLDELFPDFPMALGDIISKLLRKEPAGRYHSAFGLAADFDRCWQALRSQTALPPFALGSKDKLRELNYRIPVVGRQREIATLNRLFDETVAGGGALSLIGAPSGTGKSRLAFEILMRARRQRALISYVKFSEYERNLPLSALTVLVTEHARYLESLAPPERIAWRSAVEARLGARLKLIVDRFACYAPFFQGRVAARSSEGENSPQVFNETLGEFLCLLAARQECQLLLIDDLQWADWQSLQVLAAVGRRVMSQTAARLMLLGTYRSNEIQSDHPLVPAFLAVRDRFNLIELGPLERADADTLVEYLLDEAGPEVKKLQNACFGFTGGNPFFIYEYLKSAIETGVFALADPMGAWRFNEAGLHRADLSDGVASLVVERLRGLSDLQRALSSIASIAGHAMRRSALVHLLPILAKARRLELSKARDLEQQIELAYHELLRKNILAPDPERFAFFHDKVQEASYSLLTDDEKSTLHHAYGAFCISTIAPAKGAADGSAAFEAAYHICKGGRLQLDAQVRSFLLRAANDARRVFAYEKAKEYLDTLLRAIAADEANVSLEERFDALEAMADTLSISGEVAAAMAIYDQLLSLDCQPIKRAHIYAKKVEFCLNLFDYKNARKAAEEALKVLGDRILTTELKSYVYIALVVPALIIYCLYFKLFGRQSKEIQSDAENIRLLLLLKSEISQYFTQPIVAIANLIPLTFELLPYKDNTYRATMICYWGVALSAFGIEDFSNRFFSRAYEYFDRMANPVDKGFVLFVWGFTSDLPRGKLGGAQAKLEEAVSNLAPLGESFWRSISILGLLLLDYYGGETGQAGIRAHEVCDLWKKARYAATPLGCALRHHLENGDKEQTRFLLEQVEAADRHIQGQGYDSIDSVFACVSIAEHLDYQERYEEAERFAQRAFQIGAMRLHRVTYALLPPIIYARVLIHRGKLFRAFVILLLAWLNQLMRVRVFFPHTCNESGRWLLALGLPRLAQSIVQRGVRSAARRQWWTPAAEGHLLLGQILAGRDPELATTFLRMAREYFEVRHWKFHEALCEKEMSRLKAGREERFGIRAPSAAGPRDGVAQRSLGLRQQVEVQSLMSVLLKLSAINATEPLFQALLESLCHATGSELAVLYLEADGRFQPHIAHNLKIEPSDLFRSKVDLGFVHETLEARPSEPAVRKLSEKESKPAPTTGSVMMIPMMSEGIILGYCYLANTQLYSLFDRRSVEIALPIATQGAIALRNIRLNMQLSVERDEIAELHRTLERRVIEQTRDIKSIMKHIKIGICTISGDGAAINKDYSQFLERLLGETQLRGKPLLPLLFHSGSLSPDEAEQARHALISTLSGPDVAFDLNSHLLPRALSGHSGTVPYFYELDWSPICDDLGNVERILVTISDVTEVRDLQARAAAKDEELRLIDEILACSDRDWSRFMHGCRARLATSRRLAAELDAGGDRLTILNQIFIQVHTLKGNARSLGLKKLNEVIHANEQYLVEVLRSKTASLDATALREKLDAIDASVAQYAMLARERLRRSETEVVSLPRPRLRQIYRQLQTSTGGGEPVSATLVETLQALRATLFQSLSELFRHLFKEAEPIAVELGKGAPEFKLEVPALWVDESVAEVLRDTFVHLLRNALDHGLQPAAERRSRGLPERGSIRLTVRPRGAMLELCLEDDGRGLNLQKLRELGLRRGLIAPAAADDEAAVAALIFHPDLSTAERVTDLSGRGVGMTAVKKTIQDLGGTIELQLSAMRRLDAGHKAVAFMIRLPATLFEADPEAGSKPDTACA